MPEPITPDEKKEETPAQEEGYDYAKDHDKTVEQIVHEEKPTEEKPESPKEEPQPEKKEEPILSPLDEAKKYLEEQRKADKLEAERIARETTEKHLKQTEEKKIQAAKDAEEDKPIWEREGREPKDWKEVAAENRRIAKREVLRDLRAEQQAEKAQQEKQKAQQQAAQEQTIQTIDAKIKQEMDELYEGGYLPRPKSADPKDPGEIAKAKLFELGIKINEERKAAGLDPEPSIAKIFFMNTDKIITKEEAQPAGADAPVSGAKPAVTQQDDGYVYARDHGKSLYQIAMESRQKN